MAHGPGLQINSLLRLPHLDAPLAQRRPHFLQFGQAAGEWFAVRRGRPSWTAAAERNDARSCMPVRQPFKRRTAVVAAWGLPGRHHIEAGVAAVQSRAKQEGRAGGMMAARVESDAHRGCEAVQPRAKPCFHLPCCRPTHQCSSPLNNALPPPAPAHKYSGVASGVKWQHALRSSSA